MTNKKWKMRQIFVAFSEYRNFSIEFDYSFENQKNKGWNWDCTFCMWLFREIWYSPRLECLLLQAYRAHNKTMRIYVFRNNFGYHVPPKEEKKWIYLFISISSLFFFRKSKKNSSLKHKFRYFLWKISAV